MKPDPSLLDDLARRLAKSLPDSLHQAKADIERNFRAVLESGLARLDLVNREEFDTQAALLKRTRERLDALAEEVARLERERGAQRSASGPPPGSGLGEGPGG
ncbi:MAG: accessory factor UbiK family protein [Gammaproteobacteria bacterium]